MLILAFNYSHFSFFILVDNPDIISEASLEPTDIGHQPLIDLAKDTLGTDEMRIEKAVEWQKNHSYVSKSAVALRCRVMPPPCLKNPYLRDSSEFEADPLSNQRSKCAGAVHFYLSFFLLRETPSSSDGVLRLKKHYASIAECRVCACMSPFILY